MASTLELIQALAQEFGKQSPEVLRDIEQKIGEITIDILSQNDCRFAGLRKSQTVTVTAGTTSYKINADFASLGRYPTIVDSNGDFVDKFTIVDEGEFVARADQGGYATKRFGRIEARDQGASGPGFYLELAEDWGETGYIKIPYYRKPTATDTELINNLACVKNGVRQFFGQFIGSEKADIAARVYLGQRSGIKESAARTTTGLFVKPPIRTQKHNLLMHKVGRGQ